MAGMKMLQRVAVMALVVAAATTGSEAVRMSADEKEGEKQELVQRLKDQLQEHLQTKAKDAGDDSSSYTLDFGKGFKPFVIRDADGHPVGLGAVDNKFKKAYEQVLEENAHEGRGSGGMPANETASTAPIISEDFVLHVNSLGPYPGANIAPEDEVKVDSPLIITFDEDANSATITGTLSGLEPSATGGIHVHEGSRCETAGPHYWEGPGADPWAAAKWVSDENGVAHLDITTTQPYVALERDSTPGRTVVVHNAAGARVACSCIHAKDQLQATVLPLNDSGMSGFVYTAVDTKDMVYGYAWADGLTAENKVTISALHKFKCPKDGKLSKKKLSEAKVLISGELDVISDVRGTAPVNRTFVYFPIDTVDRLEAYRKHFKHLAVVYSDESGMPIGCGDAGESHAD